ncbi:MAG TPA: cupin domain-containing protein [Chloroflexota bacterium]|nr:cupin domain-containing protein [Chloroflexota bacterium]
MKRTAFHHDWVNVGYTDPRELQQFTMIGHPRLGQEQPVTPIIDGDEGFSLTVVSASPGHGPRMHNHAENETFVVLSGRWRFIVGEGDDQQEIVLGKYDTISMPNFVPRSFVNLENDSGGDEQSLVLALNMSDRP